MMPLKGILKNKLLLQRQYHLQEEAIDRWPYWMMEENIKIVNEITDEEEKERKKQEKDQQKQTPNFNPGSMMNNVSSMMNKFKP
jgi:hypothetical protein